MNVLTTVVKKNDSVAWRIIDGEALLVDPLQSLIYPLNPVGTRIWELLDGGKTVHSIISTVCDEFEGDSKTIEEDVVLFVEDLIKKGLAQLCG